MFSLFAVIAAGCVELGPLAIKKVVVAGEVIEEQVLWGLLHLKTNIADVSKFKMSPVTGGLGRFQQIIIKRKNSPSIFVNEFEQNDFANLQAVLREKVIEDDALKATGWIEVKRLFIIVLVLWGAVVLAGLGLWMNRLF